MEGVSFVVPVRNGAACVHDALASIAAQADGRPMEIIVIEDGSSDDSAMLLRRLAQIWPLRIVAGGGRGAAAAINAGVRAARFPIICQVDQDVVLGPGWMSSVTAALDDPTIGAVQGYYTCDPEAALYARAMALDLEQRYGAIRGHDTDHVCTGNSAYRAEALEIIGMFDEAFGYGYDNDVSYRLKAAGYRLLLCREAKSVHRWREGWTGYLAQQYGFGYGRIDLVVKYPRRCAGDSVSPAAMMSHPVFMGIALLALASAAAAAAAGFPSRLLTLAGASLIGGLALERAVAGLHAARRFRDPAPLFFPLLHLGRDLAWVTAIAMWLARRIGGWPPLPAHSMRPRPCVLPNVSAWDLLHDAAMSRAAPKRLLCVIPAHNEAPNLAAVVGELRANWTGIDILVIDDGSTDETATVLERLDVRWLRFQHRQGIGSAMRAALRYATRCGFDTVVRLDGDGQHRPADIERLLAPVNEGSADAALGSRFVQPSLRSYGLVRLMQQLLAACLSALTRNPVTDPTSGFWLLGPRAVRMLAEYHPRGYPEAELRLFLSRNALSTVEVPIRVRTRWNGGTSLTPVRLTMAGARVLLAMLIEPLRRRVEELSRD